MTTEAARPRTRRVIWTEGEDALLREHYADSSHEQILAMLPGRSYHAVTLRAHGMGIKKSRQRLAEMGRTSMAKVRAAHGNEHWRKPLGATHRRGRYTAVKVAEPDVWVPLHVHIWEQANGSVPDGMLVVARDGNLRNCVIENLCLRSPGEHQIRNCRPYQGLPDELVDVLHLQNEIRKTIKRKRGNEK